MGLDITLEVPVKNAEFQALQEHKDAWLAELLVRKSELDRLSLECFHGNVGYIRSAYNSNALFPTLEELFGFDVLAYLFPDWKDGRIYNHQRF